MVLERSGIATERMCLENRYTSISRGWGAGAFYECIAGGYGTKSEYTSAGIAVYGYWLAG